MDNPNPIRYSDLITPDNSITNLISQLDALIAKYESAQQTIKSAATEAAKTMGTLSGATEEQRQQIALLTTESDKLAAAYKKSNDAESETYRRRQQVIQAVKEQQRIDKLIVELNNSKEGSYNRLSAQYRLNKIRLNEMSAEERKCTETGRKLEKETKALYEEMNRLQKATGKHQLQVGQYERALGGLVGINGRYLDVLTDASKRTETFNGIMAAIRTPIGAVIGVVGALTSAFKLWKESVHETQQSGDSLDNAMAGWQAAWSRFQKSVSTFDFSGFIRGAIEAARAGRELQAVLDEAFERTVSVRLQKAAMAQDKALLEERAKNTELSYAERKKAADDYLAAMKPIYDQEIESAQRIRDKQLEYLFEVTNKRKFATDEEKKAAQEAFAEQLKLYNINEDLIKQAKEYNTAVGNLAAREMGYAQNLSAEEIRASQKIVETTGDNVKAFAEFAKQYSLTKDEEVEAYVKAEEQLSQAQTAAYNENKRIVTLKHSLAEQERNEQKRNAQARQKEIKDEAKALAQAAKEEERLAREAEERRKREIADQRAALQMGLERIHLQLSITQKETQAELNLRIAAIYKQRDIELFENRQLAEDKRKDEAQIRKKYDRIAWQTSAEFNVKMAKRDLAAMQNFANAENDLLDQNERQKTMFRLLQEKARLEAILKINERAAEKMTATEIAAIKKTIEGIEKETGRLGYNNLYELFGIGLNAKQQDALNTALDSVRESIGSLTDSWNKAAEAAENAAKAQVEAAQTALEAEIEARNAGYANEVETARKELELAKKNQEKAAKERQQAQRAQLALDSVQQASSLITATANIWKAFTGVGGIAGPALAALATATMWGAFVAAKVKATQVSQQTEQYGEGTVELLQGGSHASGHDIDLGTKRDGTRRRAEGGEFFAVINRRNSRRYRDVIPDVINSFNNGTFADRYQRANAQMSGYAVGLAGGSTDVSGLERDVAAIRQQGDETRYVDGQGNTIIRYKNLTRKIKS